MAFLITLSQGLSAIVDDEDYDAISKWKWSASAQGKLKRRFRAVRVEMHEGKQRMVLMHRAIVKARDGLVVDHINGDPLDNRRANLRVCTHQQNCMNGSSHEDSRSSRFKGVSWDKGCKKWRARLQRQYIGVFSEEAEAAAAYDKAALALAGRYAKLNRPRG